jgi:hypothetical protein
VKRVKEVDKILQVYAETSSIKKTAKILKCSKNTIKAYLRKSNDHPSVPLESFVKRKPVPGKPRVVTSETIGLIHQILVNNQAKQPKLKMKCPAIQTKIAKEGHLVSLSTVKRIVNTWKKENDPKREIFILQVPTIGIVAEFDWGYAYLKIKGVTTKVAVAFFVLRGSLFRFARVYQRESMLFITQAHLDFFDYLGLIPDDMMFDNLKTVVTDSKTKTFNTTFLRFADHYGFQVKACNRVSPEEKGTDEETVGFIRNRIFCLRDSFSSYEEINLYLEEQLKVINAGPVFRRELTPTEGVRNNIDHLHSYPSLRYDNCLQEIRTINKYNQISVDANWYSVPEEYLYPTIGIKLYPHRLELWDLKKEIRMATHKRMFGKGQYAIDLFHYLQTLHRKSKALHGSAALNQAHQTLQLLYKKYYQQRPKEFIDLLFLFREQNNPHRVMVALESLLKQGLLPNRELLINVLHQSADPVVVPFHYDKIKVHVTTPDFHIYDRMIAGGNHG